MFVRHCQNVVLGFGIWLVPRKQRTVGLVLVIVALPMVPRVVLIPLSNSACAQRTPSAVK